jgi:hypothetical protein
MLSPDQHNERYGSTHRRQRKDWAKLVAEGGVACRRADYGCLHDHEFIPPGERWDLGHPDQICPLPTAPECRECNRAAGGRNGAAATHTKNPMTIRDW